MINKDLVLKLLSTLPDSIAYLPFRKIILGKDFHKWLKILDANEKKNVSEVKEYQFRALKKLASDAYLLTPFYRKKYDASGFHPDDLKGLDDITRIPVLTRREVHENADNMVLRGVKRSRLYQIHTSGSTGTPLAIYGDLASRAREWASLCYIWRRIGYFPGAGRIEFRGTLERNVVFEKHPETKSLRVNVNRINSETIGEINVALVRSGYRYFNGYSSAIAKYCAEVVKAGIVPPKGIKGIIFSGEQKHGWQIKRIKMVFPKAHILSFYGLSERCALAVWTEDDPVYRFVPTYALVERDKDNGVLIGTSFTNTVMPIIRYKTSDEVLDLIEPDVAGTGKTLFPVAKRMGGRKEDFLCNIKGEVVSPTSLTFFFDDLVCITNSKIVQDAGDHLTVIVETTADECKVTPEINKIMQDLKSVFGLEMRIDYQITDYIPMEKTGKFKWLESRINSCVI